MKELPKKLNLKVTPGYVDLKKTKIFLANGERLTDKKVDKIVKEMQGIVGRPSLTKAKVVSPEIKARVPKKLKQALQREAKRRGETPSALIREALEQFLKSA